MGWGEPSQAQEAAVNWIEIHPTSSLGRKPARQVEQLQIYLPPSIYPLIHPSQRLTAYLSCATESQEARTELRDHRRTIGKSPESHLNTQLNLHKHFALLFTF
jgi:hypothetical protein